MTSILNNYEICYKISPNVKVNIKCFNVFNPPCIIFVTKDDKVYGLGENKGGRLGLGHTNIVEECTEIKELSKHKIKEIFVAWDFVLALNEDNQIFGWGKNDLGQLGRGQNSYDIMKPQKIDFQSNEKIIDISCGGCFTLVLLENGLIYGWGSNRYGQLALNKEKIVNEPRIIEINENQEKFKYIYCWDWSSFAITTNGLLFSWGNNAKGLLGQGGNEEICIPQTINLLNVRKISLDVNNTYFLTNDGSIYFCNKTQNTPKKIRETKKVFKDLEYRYCCDSENIFYRLNYGELKQKGTFKSLTQIIAKLEGENFNTVHICNGSGISNECKFFHLKLFQK